MLELNGLTKRFGNVTAVDNLTFTVQKGEIFGLLGENGAGKTTTLRMLATMLKPTSGTARLAGFDVVRSPEEVRRRVGFLFGGESGLYDRLTVYENIQYFGELNDMHPREIKKRIEELADIFDMKDFLNKRAGKLSKGMRQKASFARAIIHNPDVLLLDEPTSGLDVGAMREVQAFLKVQKEKGKTILFSSHTMSEVEKLCDRIAVIHKGSLVDMGSTDELLKKHGTQTLEDLFMGLVGGSK
ncbi:MAG TPA: ATP-binding cassette domain-containing protein [Thermoclostridium caenicola]|uniref:Sodium transport system ATP-binding protein n=1 Tax=Thermoclostridium caenicola TaxID=659425 RepID=A0A1M6BNT7_9FIRM|nr:ATP-binding cassette domain-containing protein [Thermoclostridium caenicola]SHI50336.1 sodium transport system ATP-binding protein [Thermoclostridium caenicola]HOK42261.1 ATP-binding cassette domain-containing protein [Thermoclostridium caenicola]HOL84206.1 ATP-binding cassette domain-containing protein [Thermoclostridium caenicola]HOP71758.1 ATP-binding cassette domain-containing protein [Thermoclostridium caenicola]HPO75974.1 ATP-binding cassette domain-containing protein [Thermoclostridi